MHRKNLPNNAFKLPSSGQSRRNYLFHPLRHQNQCRRPGKLLQTQNQNSASQKKTQAQRLHQWSNNAPSYRQPRHLLFKCNLHRLMFNRLSQRRNWLPPDHLSAQHRVATSNHAPSNPTNSPMFSSRIFRSSSPMATMAMAVSQLPITGRLILPRVIPCSPSNMASNPMVRRPCSAPTVRQPEIISNSPHHDWECHRPCRAACSKDRGSIRITHHRVSLGQRRHNRA